ncbi:MAG: hypothetical protein JSS25_08635 [Proteobacteria bacterium]|nr:hypothetical protein [Pseudomonadota bacterium]
MALVLASIATSANAQQVDLSKLDDGMPAPRTRVLVLGTAHLSHLPKDFKAESLKPVLDRLAAYRPDIITIESISGEQCDLIARHPTVYSPEDIGPYCRSTAAAKAATGLDIPAAIAEQNALLKAWPKQPTVAQRRHLASVFLAAGDDPSAVVQWLQLPNSERRAGDGIDAALAQQLDKLSTAHNEDYLIAATLAARLGLQRLYSADDHTGDNISTDDDAAYAKAIRAAWSTASKEAMQAREREDALMKSSDMLTLYRAINQPDAQRIAINADFGAALRDPSPQHFGRLYVAGWETRNLRMVANIRAAFAYHPGARVLSIVGSSHKPWLDNFLGQMQGVDIVDAETVLK